ncbi:sporulation protein [Aphanothece hegewaldii CCALA 016]|uniref:Sporulation protein n=1 Tax=Aphanothece hegewaldii CCALA 016 TaxID=2107694 RepID=A0A2T1M196_9CHRO|nr:SpoIID/LytB domain-containing protein [Aphanothece hegewaldii]PSF38451.1 sporulation protein [Aphanothece hegewaldii CCALA 016]
MKLKQKTFYFFSKKYGWLTMLLWLLFIAPVSAAVELRVAVIKAASQVNVGSSTDALIKDGAGRTLGTLSAMSSFVAEPEKNNVAIEKWKSQQIVIEPSNEGYVWIKDRWYRGRTRLLLQGKGVTAVNLVDLESYLYSVVGSEAIATWPIEALKAQAVAARTYALNKSSTGSNRFYDLDTTVQTQVYKGLQTEYSSTHEAVNQTSGQILTYNGKAILAVFHSSSGGHTENVEEVWSSALPYLRGVVDYDQTAPVFQWEKSFNTNQIGNLLGVGTVKSFIPERITRNGRIITLKVIGEKGSKIIDDSHLRKVLDLKSTLFTVSVQDNLVEIKGRGYGHGIGLSQWGAYYLSLQGVSYNDILSHYYQNVKLTKIQAN